jgi:iron complex transport system substrate-binding protein
VPTTSDRRRLRPFGRWANAALFTVVLLAAAVGAASAREVTDSAGRKVQVPDRIERIMAAGPPASVLIYMLAPEKMIGWNSKPREAERPYLNARVRDLPEIGRLTGRGNTASLETVMKAKPDVIVDFGNVNPTYISLAERTQSQTGIPYLLIDGHFSRTVEALRLLGPMLGVTERAEQLAKRAEAIFGEVEAASRAVPAEKHPRVYLARRANGLESGNRGSINTEIIERAGGINVVDAGREGGGLVAVSLEQVLRWNPDTIITTDRNFVNETKTNPAWADVEAVKKQRIFQSPNLPFGWIDGPPSVNRLLGLQWLSRLFFPDGRAGDIRADAREFYRLFYQVELSDQDLDRLMQ